MARRLAVATRPVLAGATEHADTVVHGPALTGQAEVIRGRLISLIGDYLTELEIAADPAYGAVIARQVILPPRLAAGADNPADPRIEIWARPRSDLVAEEYPWLGDVNPYRVEGGDFWTNCVLSSIAVDMTLETGDPHQAPGTTDEHDEFVYNWARSHNRPFIRVEGGFPAVIEVMTAAPPGARALIDASYGRAWGTSSMWSGAPA
jgi:hypothetical protein